MQSHCNRCGGDRNQSVLFQYQREVTSPNYSFLQCAGCGDVSTRIAERVTTGEHRTVFYPPRKTRPTPDWVDDVKLNAQLPEPLRALLHEVYFNYHHDCRMCAAMGVRAAIEFVMIDKVRDNGSLSENLRRFVEAKHISENQRISLESIIDAGSAAIHRAFIPNHEQLTVLIVVLEALVQTIYIQPVRNALLINAVPRRRKPENEKR
jgi:hypothetical protein